MTSDRPATNWEFAADGQHGNVWPTENPVDGETVFATFTEARDGLAAWFAFVANAYHYSARRARALRKADYEASMRAGEFPSGV